MFELMTEKKAAEKLGLSRRKLAEARKSGDISYLKMPCIRYQERDLDEFIERCRVNAKERPAARFGYRAAGIHSDKNYQALAGIV